MSAADILGRVRITQIVEALGGTVRHNRCQGFWRKGNGFNVKLDDGIGAWYDHARGEGGGVLDLVQKVLGCTRAEALRWVANLAGIALESKPWSKPERRHFAALRSTAEMVAQDCALWARGYEDALERTKAESLQQRNFDTLCCASRELYWLQNASPSVLLGRYVKSLREFPNDVASFIEAGREDYEDCALLAANIVVMLKKSQEACCA